MIKKVFLFFLCTFTFCCFLLPTAFSQEAKFAPGIPSQGKSEKQYRGGNAAADAKREEFEKLIDAHYYPVPYAGCSNYEWSGWCVQYFPFRMRSMYRYYIPVDFVEQVVAGDTAMLVDKQKMQTIRQRAVTQLQQDISTELTLDFNLMKTLGLETPGSADQEAFQSIDPKHYFAGYAAQGGAPTMFSVISGNEKWLNKKKDQAPYNNPESPFSWCHNWTPNTWGPHKTDHPPQTIFTSLGTDKPVVSPFAKYITAISFFMNKSMSPMFPDLRKRSPSPTSGALKVTTECYMERMRNSQYEPNVGQPAALIGMGGNQDKCTGQSKLGSVGPFWVFGKSLFTTGNAMIGGLRGLITRWSTLHNPNAVPSTRMNVIAHSGAREPYTHRVHSRDNEFKALWEADHYQPLHPKPQEGWPGGCDETKNLGHLVPPKKRSEDYLRGFHATEDNAGNHYVMARYTNITCCPVGWFKWSIYPNKYG